MQKSQYTNPTEKQTSWLKSAAFDCSCSASSTLHTAQLQKLPKFYFLYNKLFSTIFNPEKHDGVITHLEPDILECEVKWALGRSLWIKLVEWWNSSWAISNPKSWCSESDALNMLANLGSSAVATGLEKVSFRSNHKEGQCQRMLKLPHNCTHLTR